MAEKRVIEIQVKSEQANKAINDLTKSNTDLTASFEDIYGEMQPLSGRMGELEDRLYELALAGKQNTQEYKDLQTEVSKFKRVIAETDASVDGAAATMSQKLGGALGGIASAFELGQGAMISFGVSSQEVEEALLKVQSAMAISQGFQGIKEAIPSFKALGTTATNVFNNMSKASKAFAITGIGLLITAVAALVANWDSIAKKLGLVNEKQDALNSTMDAYREGAKQAIQQTTEVANSFELARQGVISKEEALFVYNETLGDSFGKAKNLNEAEALYAKKTDAYIKATALRAQAQALFAKAAEEQVKALTASLDDQRSFAEKSVNIFEAGVAAFVDYSTAGLTNLSEKADKKTEQTFQNAQKRVKKESETRSKQINDLAADLLKEAELVEKKNEIVSENEKKTQDYIKEQKSKALELAKAAWEQEKALGEKRIALGQKIVEDLIKLEEHRKEKEAKIIQSNYGTKEELAKRDAEFIKKLKEEEFKDAQGYLEAELIANENNFQAKRDLLELQRQEELANKELTEGEITAIEAKYAKQRDEISKQEQDLKIQAVQNTLATIGNLAQLFAGESEAQQKKAFEIQKAVGIAQTTIDTYKSATAAYSSLAGIPVVGPALGIAAAAAAVTAGLLNVKQIASQQFEGGGAVGGGGNPYAGAGGGDATSSVISPNFNIVGNAQATNPLAGLGGQPIQAYVVSGEVTTAQSLDRNRINYATFG